MQQIKIVAIHYFKKKSDKSMSVSAVIGHLQFFFKHMSQAVIENFRLSGVKRALAPFTFYGQVR